MKKIIFTISLLTSVALNAQLDTPIKGKEYSTARKENFNGFIGENATTLFSIDYLYISRKKQELIVRKFYKSDLQLVESVNIYENPADGFYGEPREVFFANDKIFMFSNLFDETNKITVITLEIFNDQCQKLSSAIIDTLADDENLFIQEEYDNKGFLLARSNKYSRLTEQEIGIKYVDISGKIQWQETLKSPMALQNITIEKIRFRENGPIYILCNYAFDASNSGLKDDQNLINNKYAIWAYHHEKSFLKEFEVRLKAKWVNGVQMELNHLNQLILSGYFNETRYNTVAGTFSLSIDKKMQLLRSSLYKFDDVILQKFIESKDLEKKKELEDYLLRDIAMLDNGSYFLIGERYYKYTERNYDPRTNITTTTEWYNYNSIIVSYFDSLGNHTWTDRIPKYQSSTNDYGYFSSYSLLNTGKEIYLFFNDSDKNNDLALDDYFKYTGLFNNRRFQVTAVQIGVEGPISRMPIIGLDNSFILRAKESKQISKTTMYLQCEVGREAKVFSTRLK